MEQLPRELTWKIIELVPECCNTLRLTSKLLRSRVDAFAHETSSTLIEELQFLGCTELVSEHKSLGAITLSLSVPERTADLFARRFALLELPSDFIDLIRRINYISNDWGGHFAKHVAYHINFDAWKSDDIILEYLKILMGTRVDKLNIVIEQGYRIEMDVLGKVLDGLQFSKIEIFANRLSDEAVRFLLDPIKSDNIDHFILDVTEVTIPNTMGFLLYLSSHVRSIHIKRQFVWKNEESCSIGMTECDWTPVIFEMFTRKMNTLQIDSNAEGFCRNCVTSLKQHLPQLGKALWLGASFIDENGEPSILEIDA